ncbi:hypothetical protein ACFOEP_12970 [Microbacterium amylolyticum]
MNTCLTYDALELDLSLNTLGVIRTIEFEKEIRRNVEEICQLLKQLA